MAHNDLRALEEKVARMRAGTDNGSSYDEIPSNLADQIAQQDNTITKTPGVNSIGPAGSPVLPKFAPNIQKENITQGRLNAVDNILNQFESYTYKWRFFAAEFSVANGEEDWTTANTITIAESGNSARFFLTEMEILSYVSINSKTRTMPHTQFEFVIEEPKGISFMDALYDTVANQLGIANHILIPYYLQLEFYAQDSAGTQILVPDYSFVWSVNLINMQANISQDGSRYTFTAIASDDVPTLNQFSIIPVTFTFRAKTVGEFFAALEDRLTSYHESFIGINYLVADKYRFNLSPEIIDLQLKSLDPSKDAARTKNDQFIDDTYVITIPMGYDVPSIVENVMVACEEWYKEISIPVNNEKHEERIDFSRLWKTETSVNFLDYDIRRNEYAKEYSFNIFPYKTERNNADIVNKSSSDTRLQKVVSEFEIKKAYEYIYTGQNTEVISFDFNLEMLWFSNLPSFTATTVPSNGARVSPAELKAKANNLADQKFNLGQKIDKFSSSELTGKFTDLSKELSVVKDQIRDTIDPITGLTQGALAELNTSVNARGSTLTQSVFVEDLENPRVPIAAGPSINDSEAKKGPIIKSMHYDANREDAGKTMFIEGPDSVEKGYVATYLEYHNNAEMTSIQLEVRGDPFWLGRTKLMRKWATSPEAGALFIPEFPLNDDTVADYSYRDNLFMLHMNAPKPENPDGFYEVEGNELYTGFYQVISVTSKFNNGMFTQTLDGIKDTNTAITLGK